MRLNAAQKTNTRVNKEDSVILGSAKALPMIKNPERINASARRKARKYFIKDSNDVL